MYEASGASVCLLVCGGERGGGGGLVRACDREGVLVFASPAPPALTFFFVFFFCFFFLFFLSLFFFFCFKARKCITYTEESAQPYEQKNIEMYTSEQLLYRHMMTSGCFSSPALLVDTIIAVDRETMNVPQLPSRDWPHCSVLVSGSVIC